MKLRSSFLGDRLFALIVLTLVVVGFSMFSSAALGLLARPDGTPLHLAFTQISLGLIPGIAALIMLRLIPLSFIERFATLVYIGATLLTALVFVPGIGKAYNGATRWIDLGITTVQPSEFLKIAVIIAVAAFVARMRGKLGDIRTGLIPFCFIVGLPCALLLAQPNTSTVLVIGATSVAMYFLAGAPWRDLGIMLLVVVAGLTFLLFTRSYLFERIQTFINPGDNAQTTGYQIQQSLIAIGSGGLLGRGFGQSVQKFNYLPEPVGDSIFAVFGEEFGLLGTLLVVLLFLAFGARGFSISAAAGSAFAAFLGMGLTLMIVLSAYLNIGSMLGVLPLTGLPLPFMSHGGTALLVALASVGLILNVAAHRAKKEYEV